MTLCSSLTQHVTSEPLVQRCSSQSKDGEGQNPRLGVKVNREKNTAESWVRVLIGDPCVFQVMLKRKGSAHKMKRSKFLKIMSMSSTFRKLICMQKRPLPQYASLPEK